MRLLIFAIQRTVVVGSWVSRWKMKNTGYYPVEMEQLIIAAVAVIKLALLTGCHRVLPLYVLLLEE